MYEEYNVAKKQNYENASFLDNHKFKEGAFLLRR